MCNARACLELGPFDLEQGWGGGGRGRRHNFALQMKRIAQSLNPFTAMSLDPAQNGISLDISNGEFPKYKINGIIMQGAIPRISFL